MIDKKDIVNIHKKTLKPSNLAITSRVMNNWVKKKVFRPTSYVNNKRTWYKLDVYDYTWLSIINHLRHLGVSLKTILKIKDYLHEEVEYSNNNNESPTTINQIRLKGLVDSVILGQKKNVHVCESGYNLDTGESECEIIIPDKFYASMSFYSKAIIIIPIHVHVYEFVMTTKIIELETQNRR